MKTGKLIMSKICNIMIIIILYNVAMIMRNIYSCCHSNALALHWDNFYSSLPELSMKQIKLPVIISRYLLSLQSKLCRWFSRSWLAFWQQNNKHSMTRIYRHTSPMFKPCKLIYHVRKRNPWLMRIWQELLLLVSCLLVSHLLAYNYFTVFL